MANLPPIDVLAQAIKIIRSARSGAVAVTVLQYYDWLLLLDQEVEFVHNNKWTPIRALYILTRYYPLLAWPIILYSNFFDHDMATCREFRRPIHILQFPFQCLAQFVMVYRACAFAEYKPMIMMLLGSCYLALLGIELWAFLTQPSAPQDAFLELIGKTGCYVNYGNPLMQLRVTLMMFAAVIMDLISLLVVLFRVRSMVFRRNNIPGIFIQEGLLSFLGVVVVNLVTAIKYFAEIPHNAGGLSFMFLMSNMFACRTILHLRKAGKRSEVASEATDSVVLTTITTGA